MMEPKKTVRTVRIDDDLWLGVIERCKALQKTGYPPISVSDVIRTGLREFIGEGKMSDAYGTIAAAESIRHVEDEP